MARAAVAPVLRTAARSAPGPARSSVDGAGAWRSPQTAPRRFPARDPWIDIGDIGIVQH